ncbi:MAG: integrase arm-type DNA-binding domain-containing protein [Pseudolabrys sp.]|nr:integrase arm-type DNA-binding domain-containing protein [Pseudolabrys sp.]
MPRPRRDGSQPEAPKKAKLTEVLIRNLEPRERPYRVYDLYQRGLSLQIQPTGLKTWKCIYSLRGRRRWFSIGGTHAVGLADARVKAAEVLYKVTQGLDPCAEKKAARGANAFEEVATRYVEEHAKIRNRSWRQADKLVRRHLLPRWGKLQINAITRQDVKTVFRSIAAPMVANQTLTAASAIFNWAIREELLLINPCRAIEHHPRKSRERVLAGSELPFIWRAFDDAGLHKGAALKVILLTGQRPGEVRHMRREHIVDGWWQMPGAPDPKLGWPGTKNGKDHRVWLPAPVLEVLSELPDDEAQIFRGLSLDGAMQKVRKRSEQEAREAGHRAPERFTPHDLRRTHGTTITALGFGRDAMNRIQNHVEGGIGEVYDRHAYSAENKNIMENVAAHIVALAKTEVAATSKFNQSVVPGPLEASTSSVRAVASS